MAHISAAAGLLIGGVLALGALANMLAIVVQGVVALPALALVALISMGGVALTVWLLAKR